MRWTARVVTRAGRQVIQVRQDGFFVGEYASVDEIQADPLVLVDFADLELEE